MYSLKKLNGYICDGFLYGHQINILYFKNFLYTAPLEEGSSQPNPALFKTGILAFLNRGFSICCQLLGPAIHGILHITSILMEKKNDNMA